MGDRIPWVRYSDPDVKFYKLNAERNNGRAAMMGIIGMMIHEGLTGNPLWPLCIALPIQLASLLMTLVRKGLLTARGYHLLYTASLCVPFVVGECSGVAVRGAFVDGVRRSDGDSSSKA